MIIVSWFVTIRIADWTVWRHKIAKAAFLLYFIVSGIHPAAVKCPVWASVVGRSSHVKLSVRSIARSILRCRNLVQENETVMSGSLLFRNHWKNIKEFGYNVVMLWAVTFFENKVLKWVIICLFVADNSIVFFVQCLYTFNVQETWPLISKSDIWTIHICCLRRSLCKYER